MVKLNCASFTNTMERVYKGLVALKRQKNLDYEKDRLSFVEWICAVLAGILLDGIMAFCFFNSVFGFFILSPVIVIVPIESKKWLKEKKKKKLKEEFKEAILILSSFLSAGYSVENAFVLSEKELIKLFGKKSFLVREWKRIIEGIQVNKAVEGMLSEFALRTDVEEIQSFAEVFEIAKRSGGELVSIIAHTASVIRDKMMLSEEIQTITAAKLYEQKIMNVIPFIMILYLRITAPGFLDPMYQTMFGKMVMSLCLCVYFSAIYISRRILNITV